MSDQELIEFIKEDQDYLGIVYKNCKENCLGFLKMKFPTVEMENFEDVFHEAILILNEKIIFKNFELTSNSSIQTYLNSVCRYQLLYKLRSENPLANNINEELLDILNSQYDDTIQDSLDPIEHENEELFTALEQALKYLKEAGGKCYELLVLRWYKRKSMSYISEYFGYTNAGNAKHQKARCQKRLKELAYSYLNV